MNLTGTFSSVSAYGCSLTNRFGSVTRAFNSIPELWKTYKLAMLDNRLQKSTHNIQSKGIILANEVARDIRYLESNFFEIIKWLKKSGLEDLDNLMRSENPGHQHLAECCLGKPFMFKAVEMVDNHKKYVNGWLEQMLKSSRAESRKDAKYIQESRDIENQLSYLDSHMSNDSIL